MNNKLYNFLIEAKKQTYANENVEKVSSSRKGSHDYHYQNNEMIYHDTYFGELNLSEKKLYITMMKHQFGE